MVRRLAVGLCIGTAVIAAQPAEAVYWDTFNGVVSAYQFNDNNFNFDTAEHQARFEDQAGTIARTFLGAQGHLAAIQSTAENQLVTLMGQTRGSRWIGFSDSATYGGSEFGNTSGSPLPAAGQTPSSTAGTQRGEGWVWTNGEPVLFQNWNSGEPNNSGTENYAEISQTTGGWNDLSATAGVNYAGGAGNLRRSIIEFNPATAPKSKWTVTTYKAQDIQINRVTVGNLTEAKQVIAGTRALPAGTPQLLEPSFNGGAPLTQAISTVNFVNNSSNQGFFTPDAQYPGFGVGPFTGDQNQFVIRATGNFTATTGGLYTFGVNSDDGFGLIVRDNTNAVVAFQDWSGQSGTGLSAGELQFAGGRGHQNNVATTASASYGRINLAAAGQYSFELVHFEGDGGTAVLEAYYMLGTPTDYAANAVGTNLSFSDGTWTVIGGAGDLVTSNLQATTYKLYNQVNYPDIVSLANADALVNNTFAAPLGDLNQTVAGNQAVTGFTNVINFLDGNNASQGNFGVGQLGNDTPLGIGGNSSTDDYVIRGVGFVRIEQGGIYTFGANGDDGFRLRLDLNNDGIYETTVLSRDGTGGVINVFGNINLAQGVYGIEYIGYDRSSNFASELFAAFNPLGTTVTSFTQLSFDLVGDVENGGLRVGDTLASVAFVPEPATLSLGLLGMLCLARRRSRAA